MKPNDREELRGLLKEIMHCAEQNAREDAPVPPSRPSFKDGVGIVYQLIGIGVSLLVMVGFFFTLKGSVLNNIDAISELRSKAEKVEERLRQLELKLERTHQ